MYISTSLFPLSSILLENDTASYQSSSTIAKGYQEASSNQYYQNDIDTDNGMMHNRMNTNLDILIKNCKMGNLADSRNK